MFRWDFLNIFFSCCGCARGRVLFTVGGGVFGVICTCGDLFGGFDSDTGTFFGNFTVSAYVFFLSGTLHLMLLICECCLLLILQECCFSQDVTGCE